jgi:hypothetical protein
MQTELELSAKEARVLRLLSRPNRVAVLVRSPDKIEAALCDGRFVRVEGEAPLSVIALRACETKGLVTPIMVDRDGPGEQTFYEITDAGRRTRPRR